MAITTATRATAITRAMKLFRSMGIGSVYQFLRASEFQVRDSLTSDFEVRAATAVDPDSPLVITPRVTLTAVRIPVLAKHQNSATGVGFTVRTATIRTTAYDNGVAAPASAEPSAFSGGIPDATVIVITSIVITSIITAGGSAILAPAPPLQIKGITFTASPVILNAD